MGEGFAEVEHTADVALRVWGEDLAGLFASAARGMAWLITDLDTVPQTVTHAVELAAGDAETLLVTWLGELLYLNEREGVVLSAFDLEEVTPTSLRGTAQGGPAPEIRCHIKAVTFSDLRIQPGAYGLETTVVFDV